MAELNIGTVYKSMWEGIKELPAELQAEIYNTIFEYQFTGIEPEIKNVVVKAIFISHKPSIDNMIAKQRAQIENGKKGGRPKKEKPKENQENPNKSQENPEKPKETQAKARVKSKDIRVKSKDNINKEKENNIKEKEKNLPAQTAVPDSFELQPPEPDKPKPKAKPNTPQGKLCDYFKSRYKANTGIDYLATESDYSQLDKLIKQYGEQQVKQKIDWLEIGCMHPGVYWFANDFSSFTIGKLRNRWNEILPVLTAEQRKAEAKRKHDEELIKRVEAELAKDAAYQKQKQGRANAIAPRNN